MGNSSDDKQYEHLTTQEVAICWSMYSLRNDLKKPFKYKMVQDAILKHRQRSDKNATGISPQTLTRLYNGETYVQKKIDKRRTKAHVENRGAGNRKTTKAQDKQIQTIVNRLHRENEGRDVVARQINVVVKDELDIDVTDQTISRRMREAGRPWKKIKKSLPLNQKDKDRRVAFAKRHRRKQKRFWSRFVLEEDEKTFPYHASKRARQTARTYSKTGGYFAEDEADLATAADKGKHRQGYKPVKVAVSVGNGRIRSVLFYKGELRKGAYVDIYAGSNFD